MAAVITGTGLFTPAESISNAELVESYNAWVRAENDRNAARIEAGDMEPLAESSVEFIEKASGIRSRYVMNKSGILDIDRMVPDIPDRPNEEPSILCEMGVAAARDALQRAGREAADVDAVLVACSNLQRAYPAISIEVQNALGIEGWGYDMNVACSSATFGIQAAVNAVAMGAARAVLVVSPEICSGHLNFRDRDSHFIFGDVATAVLVEREAADSAACVFDVLGTRLMTQFSNNIRNNFGFLNRCDPAHANTPDKLFVQNGRSVFKEVCPAVAQLITAHLEELSIPVADLRRMWLHQANANMNSLISRKVLGREPEADEAPVVLDTYANTSSAGSIIAFRKYQDDLRSGDIGVICSFGAGYSIGSVVVRRR